MRIAILLLLATCACTQSTYLTKPNLTDATFAQDSRECGQHEDQSVFNNCMRGKGYRTETSIRPIFKIPQYNFPL